MAQQVIGVMTLCIINIFQCYIYIHIYSLLSIYKQMVMIYHKNDKYENIWDIKFSLRSPLNKYNSNFEAQYFSVWACFSQRNQIHML